MAAAAKAAHEALVEMVAEGDDALMQEFFDEGTLPVPDLKKGLREAVQSKRLLPVLVASGLHNIGADAVLDLAVEVLPAPSVRGTTMATTQLEDGETLRRPFETASRSHSSCTRRSRILLRDASPISRSCLAC